MAYEKVLSLDDVTIKNNKVRESLQKNLESIMTHFQNLDLDQDVVIFIDSEKDFCAWDSVKYRLTFGAYNKKIGDILSSPYNPVKTTFRGLSLWAYN